MQGRSYLENKSFAFDFDGVVADTMSLFAAVGREEFGLSDLYPEKITDYDVSKCIDADQDTLLKLILKIIGPEYNHRLKPMEGAASVLLRLYEKSGPLLFVTARPDSSPVNAWLLDILGLKKDSFEVIATGSFDNKAEVLKEKDKLLFVEDRIETCFYLQEADIKPLLFVQPWNRRAHSFTEVKSWSDIAAFFGV